MKKSMLCLLLNFLLISCNLAPVHEHPFMPVPSDFKETGKWIPAKSTSFIPRAWWKILQDSTLQELENQIPANQSLKVSLARYQEANALVQVAQSALYPAIGALFDANRQEDSRLVSNPTPKRVYNHFLIAGQLNYELDLWGGIRNKVLQNQDLAKASAADLRAVTLSLQAQLASSYISLRGCDEAQRILDKTVHAYQKALDLTIRRYKGGISPVADVDQAQTQLENAKTLAADMRLQRAQWEHAIAVLIGRFPADFRLLPGKLPVQKMLINPDLPSTLLGRRPDVAAAVLRVEAANAKIGVARAAFFPVIDLYGIGGFESKSLSNIFTKPGLFWSLGPVSTLAIVQPLVTQVIFDGGRLWGLLRQANAQYFETVAAYRQTVLTAFQEVEDSLVAIRQLTSEEHTQRTATQAAIRAYIQAQNRYKGGLTTFLDVVVVENAALQTELTLVNIRTRLLLANVQLVRALGGGWEKIECINQGFGSK